LPAAFVGDAPSLSLSLYNIIVGGVLLYAAFRRCHVVQAAPSTCIRPLPLWVGAEYGSRRFSHLTRQRVLAAVLMIAALKLLLA
jgi:hypothetical protein